MFADESSNGSTSSTCSSKAAMFMIDNLLHHKEGTRDARNPTAPSPRVVPPPVVNPIPLVIAPEPDSHLYARSVQFQHQPSSGIFHHIQMCAPPSPSPPLKLPSPSPPLTHPSPSLPLRRPSPSPPLRRPSPSGSVSPSRETPPLSEALFRSLDVINSFNHNPDFIPHYEPLGNAPMNMHAPYYSPEVAYQTTYQSVTQLPPKKRHRQEFEHGIPGPDHVVATPTGAYRPISPANSTTSSLGDDDASPAEKKKKSRTNFSNYQLSELEMIFSTQRYLPAPERKIMAQRLQLSERKVKTWFQNRRMKDKKFPRDEHSAREDHQNSIPLTGASPLMTSPHQMPTTTHLTPMIDPRSMTSLPPGITHVPVTCFSAVPPTSSMHYAQMNPTGPIATSNFDYGMMMAPSFGYAPGMVVHGKDSGSLPYSSPSNMTIL